MIKEEIKKEVDDLLDRLGKVIDACEPHRIFDATGKLRQSFEYLLAASSHLQFRYEDKPKPEPLKLIRREILKKEEGTKLW